MANSIWKDRARECADDVARSCRRKPDDRALHLADVIAHCAECDERCPGVDRCPRHGDPAA